MGGEGLYLADGASCTERRLLIPLFMPPSHRLQSPLSQGQGWVLKEGSISRQGRCYVLVNGPGGCPIDFPDSCMWRSDWH